MISGPLSHLEAREAFHTFLLLRLAGTLPRGTWRVKGGVNLRLFGSIRYSEDMDLDAEPRARDALKRETRKAIADPHLRARLIKLGIRDVRQDGRVIHKDTETTLRIKMQLVAQGGVPFPTKLEFLDASDRVTWAERWDEQRVFVADLAEAILGLPGGRDHPTADAIPVDDDDTSLGGTG
jgi:hypothetical protein